jgi:hypothetical protein
MAAVTSAGRKRLDLGPATWLFLGRMLGSLRLHDGFTILFDTNKHRVEVMVSSSKSSCRRFEQISIGGRWGRMGAVKTSSLAPHSASGVARKSTGEKWS